MLINERISVWYFIKQIKWDILAIATYAVAAGMLDHYDPFLQLTVPLSVSGFVGTTLSLLLAFRTSQSYERWWEARIVWGAIVNDSRTLIRQIMQFLPRNAESQPVIKNFAQRQIIWCYALSESLRRLSSSDKVKVYFEKDGLESINKPNLLLNKHADSLSDIGERFNLDANKQVQIDATIARLCDSMGKCERIKNTIFPRSYSELIHFLIYVFMSILPFGLEGSVLVEIFLTFLIPILFIAIERTAIIMQDPFENKPTDTPMTTLCQTIENNLLEMVGESTQSVTQNKGTYYIM